MKNRRYYFTIIALIILISINCTAYNHSFLSESLIINSYPKKYSHSVIINSFGSGNWGKNMKERGFFVSVFTKILIFDKHGEFELDELSNIFVIDSIYLYDSLNNFFEVLFPRGTYMNNKQFSRNINFSSRIEESGKLSNKFFPIPDSITTLTVAVPYYSIIKDIKIYDTLTTVLHRTVESHKFYIN